MPTEESFPGPDGLSEQDLKGLVESLGVEGACLEDILAYLGGYDVAEVRRLRSMAAEAEAAAAPYRLSPPGQWPALAFNWDFHPDSQRFALDGVSPNQFQEQFPGGLVLGEVPLLEFDAHLNRFNRRSEQETWSVGDEGKLAKALGWVLLGFPMTPPLVTPIKGQGDLTFSGGNHRYAVAKASRQEMIPIYARREDIAFIDALMPVPWKL